MDWAKAQGATRSEAIRRLVEIGLSKPTRRQAGSVPSTQKALRAMDEMAEDLHKIGSKAKK